MPAVMAASTFTFFALAVAASELQSEFSISRLQLGLLGATNTGVGAIIAPSAGRFTDRVGARNALATTLLFAIGASVMSALSASFSFLMIASAVSGIPQGLGNPATNKAIVEGLDVSVRGAVVGLKQSGVQLGVVGAGLIVPLLSPEYGWRSVMWIGAGFALALMPGLAFVGSKAAVSARANASTGPNPPMPALVTRVAVYAFLLGLVGGGFSRFIPLFAEEVVNVSIAQAGQVFAITGFVAVPARLVAGAVLDRGFSARRMMISLAVLGMVAVVLVNASSGDQPMLLWAGAIIAGLSLGTWNTPANLVVIRQESNTGRATGRLAFGFLMGLSVGGPLLGLIIDRFGYQAAWLSSAALALVAAATLLPRDPEVARDVS